MSEALCHEIACLLEHSPATQHDVDDFYGVDNARAHRNTIVFMRRCLRAEIEEMVSRGSLSPQTWISESFAGMLTRSKWAEITLIFTLHESGWLPSDVQHLRYLHSRARTNDYYAAFAVEIQARIEVAEAAQAIASILGREL